MESKRIYKLQTTRSPRFSRASAVLMLIFAIIGAATSNADPTPFKATYKATFNGIPISAKGTRELIRTEDNHFLLVSSAKSFLGSITEQTLVTLDDKNQISPLEYQYHRTGIGRNRDATLTFDWDAMRVLNDVQSKPWKMDISHGMQDKLSYQLKMREQLTAAYQRGEEWPPLDYHIADGGLGKHYVFEIVGEENVKTPAGVIRTFKARRANDDDRETVFWLAPDYEFLLIRFEQTEDDGDGFKLMLKEAVFDGVPITGKADIATK